MRKPKGRGKQSAETGYKWHGPAVVGVKSIAPDATKDQVSLLIEEMTMFSRDISHVEIHETDAGLAVVLQPNYAGLSPHHQPALCAKIEDDVRQLLHHRLRVRA